MTEIPDDLKKLIELVLDDLDDPGDTINESADFILVMRRQDLDGNDEVIPYTSANVTASVLAGMLQLSQHLILGGTFSPYEDD